MLKRCFHRTEDDCMCTLHQEGHISPFLWSERSERAPGMGKTKRADVQGPSPGHGGTSFTTDIIPGLPNEVAVMILARLPRALHASLRCVCCAWRNALQPLATSALRSTLQISEIWTLFLFKDKSITLYDPLLQHLSSPTLYFWDAAACALRLLGAVGSQVFFLHHEQGVRADIRCFDAACMQWQSDPIPLRSNNAPVLGFVSAVVDGHLWLLGGGHDGREVSRFDVKSRVWEMMPNMHKCRLAAAAAVSQDCLHVIGGGTRCDGFNLLSDGEIWDPRMGEWVLEPALWPAHLSNWPSGVPMVAVVMDTLYILRDSVIGLELLYYVSESKCWMPLGHLPLEEYAGRCYRSGYHRLVVAGKELWVVLSCDGLCTAKILSCVPATGSSPLLWRRVPITSSIKFRPGDVTVLGNVHV
eukprot:c22903_g2_i1 orf=288-1529(+)